MTQDDLVRLAELFSSHRGLALSTLGRIAAGDGKFFLRLRDGGSCTMRTGEAVAMWFVRHWPADLAWPRSIPQPKPTRVAA